MYIYQKLRTNPNILDCQKNKLNRIWQNIRLSLWNYILMDLEGIDDELFYVRLKAKCSVSEGSEISNPVYKRQLS